VVKAQTFEEMWSVVGSKDQAMFMASKAFILKKYAYAWNMRASRWYGSLVPKFAGTARFKSKTARFQPLL